MKALIRWSGEDDSFCCVCCVFNDSEEPKVREWILSIHERSLEHAKRRVEDGKPYYSPDTYSIEDEVYPSFQEWLDS